MPLPRYSAGTGTGRLPATPMDESARAASPHTDAPRLRRLPRRVWPLRTLGMGLAFLPISVALTELHASPGAWGWAIATCLIWPQLAMAIALRARDPHRQELRNLIADSAIAGTWAPLIAFNLLPSALLIATVTADKLNVGERGLLKRALPWTVIGMAVSGVFTGFAVHAHSSHAVALATIPIVVVHSLMVSVATHGLIDRLRIQNLRLTELARQDDLTGLDARSYWMEQVERMLARHRRDASAATLIALDIDNFKAINDGHGHAVGDAVLRAIANRIRGILRAGSHAGRIGGDEFVIALQADVTQARIVAERLRQAVADTRFEQFPTLQCTISLGIADIDAANGGVPAWLDAADRALYAAKRAGRNQIAIANAE